MYSIPPSRNTDSTGSKPCETKVSRARLETELAAAARHSVLVKDASKSDQYESCIFGGPTTKSRHVQHGAGKPVGWEGWHTNEFPLRLVPWTVPWSRRGVPVPFSTARRSQLLAAPASTVNIKTPYAPLRMLVRSLYAGDRIDLHNKRSSGSRQKESKSARRRRRRAGPAQCRGPGEAAR